MSDKVRQPLCKQGIVLELHPSNYSYSNPFFSEGGCPHALSHYMSRGCALALALYTPIFSGIVGETCGVLNRRVALVLHRDRAPFWEAELSANVLLIDHGT